MTDILIIQAVPHHTGSIVFGILLPGFLFKKAWFIVDKRRCFRKFRTKIRSNLNRFMVRRCLMYYFTESINI